VSAAVHVLATRQARTSASRPKCSRRRQRCRSTASALSRYAYTGDGDSMAAFTRKSDARVQRHRARGGRVVPVHSSAQADCGTQRAEGRADDEGTGDRPLRRRGPGPAKPVRRSLALRGLTGRACLVVGFSDAGVEERSSSRSSARRATAHSASTRVNTPSQTTPPIKNGRPTAPYSLSLRLPAAVSSGPPSMPSVLGTSLAK
jgi:hypothetical protein